MVEHFLKPQKVGLSFKHKLKLIWDFFLPPLSHWGRFSIAGDRKLGFLFRLFFLLDNNSYLFHNSFWSQDKLALIASLFWLSTPNQCEKCLLSSKKLNFSVNSFFGPWVYSKGSLVITSVVRPSVCVSVRLSLNISETAHYFFLKLYMKSGVNKVKKVTRLEFWKKILIRGLRGIKCKKFRFLDIFAETGH